METAKKKEEQPTEKKIGSGIMSKQSKAGSDSGEYQFMNNDIEV